MNKSLSLVITDRNPHVRALLCREFGSQGFRVTAAKDGDDVHRALLADPPPDLIILDLEMAGDSGITILEGIQRRLPGLPVVIHTFPMSGVSHPAVFKAAALVEKSGDTAELQAAVKRILNQSDAGLRHERA